MTKKNSEELIREAIIKFSRKSCSANGSSFVARLSRQSGLDESDIKSILPLFKGNELSCENWTSDGQPIGKVYFNIDEKISVEQERWVSSLCSASLADTDIVSLTPIFSKTKELTDHEQMRLIKGLIQVKLDQNMLFGETEFNISARYLLGSSKLLGNLPKKALINFGIEVDKFLSAPSYLIMAGPSNPDMVILVENPQSFEAAVKADIRNIAWVTTFGYGLSKMGEEYGSQLQSILEDKANKEIIMLSRTGIPVSLDKLLSIDTIHFWGDLDLEGLKIYHSLKSKISNLELSGLCKPMIKLIEQGLGHSYFPLAGKDGQKQWSSNDSFINQLLNITKDMAIDQEVLSLDVIRNYAHSSLNEDDINTE